MRSQVSLPKLRHRSFFLLFAVTAMLLVVLLAPKEARAQTCGRTISADVVALDQSFFWNRMGAVQPQGMMYALRRDVVSSDGSPGLSPGNVQLRSGKRARPITLRMNVGDCLQIKFQNLLSSIPHEDQPATRTASIHVAGMQLYGSIASDGSNVGTNPSSLVAPGGSTTYTFYAEREGSYVLQSSAAMTGGEGNGGSINPGLFGAVNVQPKDAEWYRSQVTANDMELVTTGTTPAGQPIVNYDAVYPAGHPRAGMPILKMLQGTEIVHTDLTAIITGPNKGRFTAGTYRPNPATPDRHQPFREITTIYHDETGAVQAFPEFEEEEMGHTLAGVRDAFAINYGSAGAGAEVLANRFEVGPARDCSECKYEEFFLTSWAGGDPAMVVDVPANTTDATGALVKGPKATKAYYPDDPSNVYHSYLRDHVKFRVLHGGSKEHHIHHQHAKQWLRTPDSDNSSYLDSQALGPGASFSLEMSYHGSGNRNHTAGDAIFHCHFYPHFAQGMWALWRVHDVFEAGTPLDAEGRPVAGSRALPDGEIVAGTPIPGLVPLPTVAMPPLPQAKVEIVQGQAVITPLIEGGQLGNPGFPFFVPGVAGHRPPHPPLDTVDDGGLPRHVITSGTSHFPALNRLDFDKTLLTAEAQALPETGTPLELAAMAFHGTRTHSSYTPSGNSATFITNGLPRKTVASPFGAQPGAPFADPCVDDNGEAKGFNRIYKGANIQLDIKLNKAGWHFGQSRMISLWDDVAANLNGSKPPEPLFFRANTNDCIEYHHTNLVPGVYEQDDFQVRSPTDIIGQHIHLVKFDVTASDGAGNGFNYEDGTFSPDEVRERIHAINENGGLKIDESTRTPLTAKVHPFFGAGPGDKWLGAQTSIQRWYADEVLNNLGKERTLRTVFTHDHFGPSTHQQVGLYAGLVIEPQGSQWRHPETGQMFGSRADGGPTSWHADILTANAADSYREFLLEFTDFQLAYTKDGVPVNPPAKKEVGLPYLVESANVCPGGASAPCPESIALSDPGTMSINYRNEPIPFRVRDPATNTQSAGLAGDLSHVFRSNIIRKDDDFNKQPSFYPALTGGLQPGDPYTPLLRAYEGDKTQVRILVGGQEEGHNFTVHGLKWLFEPNDPNSGYRNSQMMGLSEHYEFEVPKLPVHLYGQGYQGIADYLYTAGSSADDLWNGLWGIFRVYSVEQPGLLKLPNNNFTGTQPSVTNPGDFAGVCPATAPVRNYAVTAVTAQQALPGGTLVYNPRTTNGGKLHDPTAVLYVRSGDLDTAGKLKAGITIEPLVLRANAGDCIQVSLTNKLPAQLPDLDGYSTLPLLVERFNANQVRPSNEVGLHPQMVFSDVTYNNGVNVGLNPVQTVSPGFQTTYQWYAGDLSTVPDPAVPGREKGVTTPIEFGATNLSSSDPIKHSNKGAVGALIIEPKNSTWVEDVSRTSATVTLANGTKFREFVAIFQNDLNLRHGDGSPVPNTAEAEDAEDSGQKAINYRTEPMWKRMGFAPNATLEQTGALDFSNVLSNSKVGGDPATPIFSATAKTPVRFRLLHPGGHTRNDVFTIHGHVWEEQPYVNNSTEIGTNPLSEWKGAQDGIGPSSHFDFVLKNGAGGKFGINGDYLYRTMASFQFDGGMWGLFRVKPHETVVPACTITRTGTNSAGKSFLEVTDQDLASGLAAIQVTDATNYDVKMPAFSVGSTAKVVVTATKINQALPARLMLKVHDVAGNSTVCDPWDVILSTTSTTPIALTKNLAIYDKETYIRVTNGSQGLKYAAFFINKKHTLLVNAKMVAGQTYYLRIPSSWLVKDTMEAPKNSITLLGFGQKGGSASVFISDQFVQ